MQRKNKTLKKFFNKGLRTQELAAVVYTGPLYTMTKLFEKLIASPSQAPHWTVPSLADGIMFTSEAKISCLRLAMQI